MRAKEVLRLLWISRPTLYHYRKKGIIEAQKLTLGFSDYNTEINNDIEGEQSNLILNFFLRWL